MSRESLWPLMRSAWGQEAPNSGWRAGWGLGVCAEQEDHSVRGEHAPLTCYCELPAAPANELPLVSGEDSQRQAEGQPFCVCRDSSHMAPVLALPLTLAANVFSI